MKRTQQRETESRLSALIDLGATWELRLGPDNRFRIFYRVDGGNREVRILAIAVKERDPIFIAGEEVDL